jgi:hypothetical protein
MTCTGLPAALASLRGLDAWVLLVFAAETAADERRDDPHLFRGKPNRLGNLVAGAERILRRSPDRHLVVLDLRQGGVGFHRRMGDVTVEIGRLEFFGGGFFGLRPNRRPVSGTVAAERR